MKQTDYNNRVEPQLGWLDDPQVFRAGQFRPIRTTGFTGARRSTGAGNPPSASP